MGGELSSAGDKPVPVADDSVTARDEPVPAGDEPIPADEPGTAKGEPGPATDAPGPTEGELSPSADAPVSTTGGFLPGPDALFAAGDGPFPVAKGLFPWRGELFPGLELCASGETEVGAGKPNEAGEAAAEEEAGQDEPAEPASGPDEEAADDAERDAEAAVPEVEAADEPEGGEEAEEEADRDEPAAVRAGVDGELTADGRRSGGGGVTDDEAGSRITDGSGRDAAGADTTAVPRTARRGPINRAARLNTLRVAVSYPSRYASSRSRTVRYHWCKRPAAYPTQAVNAASSVIRRASFPGAVMDRFLPRYRPLAIARSTYPDRSTFVSDVSQPTLRSGPGGMPKAWSRCVRRAPTRSWARSTAPRRSRGWSRPARSGRPPPSPAR
jgi:hypothetical protein